MATKTYKSVIGRAESIDFLDDAGCINVPAKIDTGAYSSSVWVSNISESNGTLEFELLGPGHELYTGTKIHTKDYKSVIVQNSFGKSEKRFGVELQVNFCGKRLTSFFTLSDRSKKIYPVLIGRKLLKGRFLVDVSIGHPVADEETEEIIGFSSMKKEVRKRQKL